MKKVLNKIGAAFLACCLIFSSFTFVAQAADGTLQFSDPNGAAGDKITVTAKVDVGGGTIGDTNITITYDESLLKFMGGTNATGGSGTVKLSTKGDGTSAEASYSMEFTALKEGTADLDVSNYTVYLESGEPVNLTLGVSKVTIQGGQPVEEGQNAESRAADGAPKVQVDGATYTVNENFSEAVIPKGFSKTETELDGQQTKAMLQQSSGQYLYYLENQSGSSDYFLYNTEDGSFIQTAVINITPELFIFLMNHKDKEGLPSEYKSTTTSIEGKEFTAWQNVSQPEYYLVYALSSEGTAGYYKYDTGEKTYQRYVVPIVEKEETKNGLSDKILDFVKNNMILLMCVIWGVVLLLLVVIIILAVKLSHRNRELDDLYDEYGLDDIDGDSDKIFKERVRDESGGDDEHDSEFEEEDEYFDDEDTEYDEEDYLDDEDTEYDEEDYLDDEDTEYDEEDYLDDGEAEYDEEDYLEEDHEEVSDNHRGKFTGRSVGKKSKSDDYTVDFIDI